MPVQTRKQYALVIDLARCIGCQTCVIACKSEHQLPDGVRWAWLETAGSDRMYSPAGEFPNTRMTFVPHLCNHCEDPACVAVCPARAMHKRDDGVVVVDQNRCIGCQLCAWACPYGTPKFDPKKRVMSKCTLCVERVEHGQQPACVECCPTKARVFGDLKDPDGEAARLVARRRGRVLKPEYGTKPSVHYVGP